LRLCAFAGIFRSSRKPIHDGYAKEFFLESRYQNFQKFLKKENIEFQWMSNAGDYFEI